MDFERDVLPLQNDLYFAAMALTRNDADATDLVQDTLLKAWRGRRSFDRGNNLKAWLFTILRNAYLDRCRRRRVEPAPLMAAEEGPAPEGRPAGPLEAVLPDELLGALRKLIPAHQLLVLLRDIEGLSYKEIASVLGCPLGTVMSGLHAARTRLRERLKAPRHG